MATIATPMPANTPTITALLVLVSSALQEPACKSSSTMGIAIRRWVAIVCQQCARRAR